MARTRANLMGVDHLHLGGDSVGDGGELGHVLLGGGHDTFARCCAVVVIAVFFVRALGALGLGLGLAAVAPPITLRCVEGGGGDKGGC